MILYDMMCMRRWILLIVTRVY